MKITIKLLAVLALMLATFSQHTTASAGDHFKFSGRNAGAFFQASDGGCLEMFAGAFANDGKVQSPPGPGSTSSFADVFVEIFDVCNSVSIYSASGFSDLDDRAFQINRTLTSASLNATIPGGDSFGNPVDISVDLVWIGTGDLSRGTFHSHSKSPGCVINSRFHGTFRPAQASGTVSVGDTNFTPNPTDNAGLGSAKSGDLFIGCN